MVPFTSNTIKKQPEDLQSQIKALEIINSKDRERDTLEN